MSDVNHTTLSNGLTIIGETNPAALSCGLGFFVKTGARDETQKESGVSHFLEHMLFKGTPKRSALQLTYDMGRIGAQSNAFTSEENTVYYAGVLPEYFADAQEILCDMLRPALDPEEFKTEKKVILEEIALYQDRPHYYLYENALREYFAGHPAGNSVLGSSDSISALTSGEMRAYFERRYAPNNMVLVASGNFKWEPFVERTEKWCGTWRKFEAGRNVSGFRARTMRKEFRKANLNQAQVLVMTDSASLVEDERYPLTILSNILGDSSGSKLYWALVDPGLADSAASEQDEKDGCGVFMAYASTAPEKLDEVAEILKGVLAEPLKFTDQDLIRAKTKLASRVVLGGELPMGRLMSLGTEWINRNRIHNLAEVAARIKAVSRTDIEQALGKYPLKTWAEFRLVPDNQ